MGRLYDLQPQRPDRAAHGYLYYRWTSRYVSVVRYFLSRDRFEPLRSAAGHHLERTHHAKVVPTNDARRLLTLGTPVELRELERVVPYDEARDIVLDAEATIVLAECACRKSADPASRSATCGPVESCLYIGDPVATFVEEHQPAARRISADEALAVVESAAIRGNVHTLWFKDAAAGRMYALCNCCSCCCIGLESVRRGFRPLAGSGYVSVVDDARCTACGLCEPVCAFAAIRVSEDATVDVDACFGCGACVTVCPEDALSLAPSAEGPEPVPWSEG